jgi:hypothetical protein
MRQDLERLRGIWEDCQANRNRNAIYAYLAAVYAPVAWWAAEGWEVDRARRMAPEGSTPQLASVVAHLFEVLTYCRARA